MNLSKRDGLVKVIKACSWLIATVMRNPPQSNGPLPLQWGKVWWHWNCHRLFHQNYVSFVFWYRWLYGVWFCVQSNLWLNLTTSYSFKWDFLWSLVHGLIVWDIYILFQNLGYLIYREIIVYSRSTINACSLLSHKWWTPLIKFMMGPTIHVRGESMHLWYSGST